MRGDPVFDIEAVDGKQHMMNHDLQGCFCLEVPAGLQTAGAEVLMDGVGSVDYILTTTGSGMYLKYVLGLKLFNLPLEYDSEYQVCLCGFEDQDGTVYGEERFTIRTLPCPDVDESHPRSNAAALQAARESIVLLKNDNAMFPVPSGCTVNFFGKVVHQFRIGTIGAGRITPRFQVNLTLGIREYGSFQMNEPLADFYRAGKDVIPDERM